MSGQAAKPKCTRQVHVSSGLPDAAIAHEIPSAQNVEISQFSDFSKYLQVERRLSMMACCLVYEAAQNLDLSWSWSFGGVRGPAGSSSGLVEPDIKQHAVHKLGGLAARQSSSEEPTPARDDEKENDTDRTRPRIYSRAFRSGQGGHAGCIECR